MNSLENWKRINDFLEVSDQGNVKSHGKLIKGEICKNGYKRINVSHKRTHFKILVHRLIAKTFIPNPENKLCVNHKDGNKLNNRVSNLEWCSYGENMKHAFKTNLRNAKGENNTQHKLTEKQVCEIRSLYEKEAKEKLEKELTDEGYKNDFVTISYSKPSESVSIDTAKLCEHEPELYKELLRDYPKVTKRKASFSYRFK